MVVSQYRPDPFPTGRGLAPSLPATPPQKKESGPLIPAIGLVFIIAKLRRLVLALLKVCSDILIFDWRC